MTSILRSLVLAALLAALAAVPAQAANGTTTLAPNQGALDALAGSGISVAPLPTTRVSDAGLGFPVTSSRVDLDTLTGRIKHTGGLRLSDGTTTVDLKNFWINLDGAPDLSALVGDDRLSIATLDLSGATVATAGRKLTVSGVGVVLPPATLALLNTVFAPDVPLPTSGPVTLGTATVDAILRGRR